MSHSTSIRNVISLFLFWLLWRATGSNEFKVRRLSIRIVASGSDKEALENVLPFEELFYIVSEHLDGLGVHPDCVPVTIYLPSWNHKLIYRSYFLRAMVVPVSPVEHGDTRSLAMRVVEEYVISLLLFQLRRENFKSEEVEIYTGLEQFLNDDLLRRIEQCLAT